MVFTVSEEAFENGANPTGWFVAEFTDPENPDYGYPAP